MLLKLRTIKIIKKKLLVYKVKTGSGNALDTAIAQLGATVPESSKEAYLKEANETLEGLYEKLPKYI